MIEKFDRKKWPGKLLDYSNDIVIVIEKPSANIVWVNKKFLQLGDISVLNKKAVYILGDRFDMIRIRGEVKGKVKFYEIKTDFGIVLIGNITNGMELEFSKFSNFLASNKERVQKIKDYNINGQAIQSV